jgi:hypothetical protein
VVDLHSRERTVDALVKLVFDVFDGGEPTYIDRVDIPRAIELLNLEGEDARRRHEMCTGTAMSCVDGWTDGWDGESARWVRDVLS